MKNRERQKLFWVWCAMRYRCLKPTDPGYKNYGGRGISVCNQWAKSFKQFLLDMGPRPSSKHSIERIDNDGNYEPNNCHWGTRRQQNSNRRNCIYVVIDGKRMTLKEACRQRGLKYRAVHKRIMDRGWSAERALSTPIGIGNLHANH
jgi:hypothetical protein